MQGGLATTALVGCAHDRRSTPASPPLRRTVIVGAHVLAPDGRTMLRDHAVAIAGDRIVAVLPRDALRLGPGDEVVAGTGKFVIPGLVDAHGHPPDAEPDDVITMAEYLALCLAAGVTSVRSCRGTPGQLELRDRIAAGTVVGPRLFVGGIVDASDPDDGARQVHARARAGYDFVKLLGCADASTHAAAVAAVAEAGLPFTGHVGGLPLADVLAGRQSIEHLDGFRAALAGGAQLDELAAATARAGVVVCPTETFLVRWWQLAEAVRWEDAPGVDQVPPAQRERWRAPTNELRITAAQTAAVRAAADADLRIIAALHASGVPLVASPSHGPWIVPGWSMLEELAIFAAAGIDRADVLATATANLAGFLAADAPWGKLAPGQRADLVLLAADPLVRIDAVHRVVAVMAAGRWAIPPATGAP